MDYSRLNDVTLLLLIGRKDENALEELFDRYGGLVFSIGLEFMDDRQGADEILQEVFTRVWLKADTFRSNRGTAKVWLASLARHCAIDMLRRRELRAEGHSVELSSVAFRLVEDEQDPEEAADLAVKRSKLRKALSQLPARQRQALALAYYRGYSHSQIAEAMHEPLGTVKTCIRSAIHKLRQVMQNEAGPEI